MFKYPKMGKMDKEFYDVYVKPLFKLHKEN